MAKTLHLNYIDDETLEILVGKKHITTVNHDEHGWSGMDAAKCAAVGVARAAGMTVKQDGEVQV